MRRDQPHEADAAGRAHRASGQHRTSARRQHAANAAYTQADRRGHRFAARQHVESRPSAIRRPSRRRAATSSHGQRSPRVRSPSSQNTMPRSRVLVAHREQQAHQRRRTGGNDDARQAAAASASSRRGPGRARTRGHGGERSERLPPRRPRGGQPEHQSPATPYGRAARHAEHVRIGERVAQQHLQQRAGDTQQAADREGRHCARQAQVHDDVPRQRRFRPPDGMPDGSRLEVHTAKHQREQQEHEGRDAERDEDRNERKSVQAAPAYGRSVGKRGRGHKPGCRPVMFLCDCRQCGKIDAIRTLRRP